MAAWRHIGKSPNVDNDFDLPMHPDLDITHVTRPRRPLMPLPNLLYRCVQFILQPGRARLPVNGGPLYSSPDRVRDRPVLPYRFA